MMNKLVGARGASLKSPSHTSGNERQARQAQHRQQNDHPGRSEDRGTEITLAPLPQHIAGATEVTEGRGVR